MKKFIPPHCNGKGSWPWVREAIQFLGATFATLPMTSAPVAHSKAALSNLFPIAINPA